MNSLIVGISLIVKSIPLFFDFKRNRCSISDESFEILEDSLCTIIFYQRLNISILYVNVEALI